MTLKDLTGELLKAEKEGLGDYITVVSFEEGTGVEEIKEIYISYDEKTIYIGD